MGNNKKDIAIINGIKYELTKIENDIDKQEEWNFVADYCKANKLSPYNATVYNSAANIAKKYIPLVKKFETGNYIPVVYDEVRPEKGWKKDIQVCTSNSNLIYTLVHKKHEDVLNVILTNQNIIIEQKMTYVGNHFFDGKYDTTDTWVIIKPEYFFNFYDENNRYRYKNKINYPIYRKSKDGEVFRFDQRFGGSYVLCENSNNYVWSKSLLDDSFIKIFDKEIPFDKKRGLYQFQPCWFEQPNGLIFIDFYEYYDDKENKKSGAYFHDKPSTHFESIIPITGEQLKVMPFIWEMYKKILKIERL